jgi:hypothetical protein
MTMTMATHQRKSGLFLIAGSGLLAVALSHCEGAMGMSVRTATAPHLPDHPIRT